jgi:hypothetical protein
VVWCGVVWCGVVCDLVSFPSRLHALGGELIHLLSIHREFLQQFVKSRCYKHSFPFHSFSFHSIQTKSNDLYAFFHQPSTRSSPHSSCSCALNSATSWLRFGSISSGSTIFRDSSRLCCRIEIGGLDTIQTTNNTQDTRHKTQDTRHKTQDTRHKTQHTNTNQPTSSTTFLCCVSVALAESNCARVIFLV